MKRTAILLSLLLAACSPSIDGAAKADLDKRLATMERAGQTVPAPERAEPMPLAVGQWTTIKQVDDKGNPALVTYKLVGAEADAFWLEVDNDTYYGRTSSRMLVSFGNRQDPSTIDIRALITRDKNGNVTQMPSSMLGMIKSSYQPILDSLVIRWNALPQEDAAVTAGSFAGCYKGVSTVALGGRSISSDVWWHPAVPINGMVRAVAHNPASTTELVRFGTTGATSSF